MRVFGLSFLFTIFCTYFSFSQPGVVGDSIIIAANSDLTHNVFHRILFGKHYRPLWATPVKIEILKLNEFGFTIIKEGGSRETYTLRLKDSLGRQFVARSVKKDLTKALPEHYQKSMLGKVFSDLMSANHPYGPLMVAPLAEAAGVYHSNPKLYALLLDSAVSDEFISDSGAMVVLLESRPDESWSEFPLYNYAQKVTGTENYIVNRLNKNDNRTDAELFLRTRLLDLLIGDWSRHEDQYRWTVRDSAGITYYQPVPRDRDHAFYKFNDGLLNKISLIFIPKTVTFGKKIKNVHHLHLVGEMLGKLILPSIKKEKWEELVHQMKNNINDSVIESSVSKLPPEIYTQNRKQFTEFLKSRRDQLPKVGKELYELIFRHPNIVGSNENEFFKVTRLNKKETFIEVFRINKKGNADLLLFSRTFSCRETKSINLFALEGEDRIEISGFKTGIKLRITPGPGIDALTIEKGVNNNISVDDSHDFNFSQFVLRNQLK